MRRARWVRCPAAPPDSAARSNDPPTVSRRDALSSPHASRQLFEAESEHAGVFAGGLRAAEAGGDVPDLLTTNATGARHGAAVRFEAVQVDLEAAALC